MARRSLSAAMLLAAAVTASTPLLFRALGGSGARNSPNFVVAPLLAGPGSVGAAGGASARAAGIASGRLVQASSAPPAAAAMGVAVATLLGVLAARRRASSNSLVACQAALDRYERKWWSVKEDRDPTTLPMWQRDFRYGHNVLRRTMVENRRQGKKTFWDVRVTESMSWGCNIEMLNSGIPGFCSRGQEGPERLEVGKTYKMECTGAPLMRVTKEDRYSIWPQLKKPYRVVPIFSHWMWLEQQKSIEHAQTIEQGTIVDGVVFKHLSKGMLITLEGGARGMLALIDVSRKMTQRRYAMKMFPEGAKMRCYVIHADKENGRITLGTKEFEDDDHMGWMLSFPERVMARAEEGLRRYNEKRTAYIKHLQR